MREAAATYGTSINQMALDLISKGVGANAGVAEYHDLDDLIGSWVQDPECDKALAEMLRRELVSAVEVGDLLLDLRSLLSASASTTDV